MDQHDEKIARRNGAGGARPPLLARARSLREACCAAGLDRSGRRCPECPVRDLCADETRWLVRSGWRRN